MKKYLNILTALLTAVLLSLPQALPVRAEEGTLSLTVLGDSIAKGYSSDKTDRIESYGQLVAKQVGQEYSLSPSVVNYAQNGLDTSELNADILGRDDVLQNLGSADIILLTVGSNDLLDEFKKEAQEILSTDVKFSSADQALMKLHEEVKKNPLLVFKIIDALSKWDYAQFESQWDKAMKTIKEHKKDDAQIIVTNIYNPVYNLNLPGTMNKVVDNIIQNMNSIIQKKAHQYGYKVADLFDSGITAHVQSDGLHPSQEGQQLIAQEVRGEIKMPAPAQSADGTAIKGEDSPPQPPSPRQESGQSLDERNTTKKQDLKQNTKPATAILPVTIVVLVILLLAGGIKYCRREKK